jgi:hypothetical protein
MILRIERAHLLLKPSLAVVRPLIVDVLNKNPEVGWAHGKQPIPPLPCKIENTLLLHPDGRSSLNLRNNLRRRLRRRQPNRKMNMVRNAACPDALATQLPHGTRKIGMKVRKNLVMDQRLAVLRAEDDMDQVKAQRLGHGRHYMAGLQAQIHFPHPQQSSANGATPTSLGRRPRKDAATNSQGLKARHIDYTKTPKEVRNHA